MGRTLKRVPYDFAWTCGAIWSGYLNPIQPLQCEVCEGRGDSPEMRALSDRWYGWDKPAQYAWCDDTHTRRWNKAAWMNNLSKKDVQALLRANRLWDFTRVPRNRVQAEIVKRRRAEGQNGWLPFHNGYTPTPEEVNAWSRHCLGHDSLNAWVVTKARAQRLGLPIECAVCQGEGHLWLSPEIKAAYEAWEPTEPPAGDGYQLWETTTEGSPVSPIFVTLWGLCEWCAEHATTFGSSTATVQQWEDMLSENGVHHEQGGILFV